MRPLHFTALLCSLLGSLSAQLPHFGSLATSKTGPPFSYAVYGYYDLVREAGIGFQHQFHPLLCMDYSVYALHANGFRMARQWDYYDFSGAGFSIKPKIMLSRDNRFYISPTLSVDYLKHDRVWVEDQVGRSTRWYSLDAAKGWGSSLGLSLGVRCYARHILIEPFVSLGVTTAWLDVTSYAEKSAVVFNGKFKYTEPTEYAEPKRSHIHKDYFFSNFGVKIGFGWKRPAKDAAIQARFDEVYIPHYNRLLAYLNQQPVKNPDLRREGREALIRAKELAASADRNLLRIYRWRYPNPEKLYRSVDAYFKRIDEQIIQATQ